MALRVRVPNVERSISLLVNARLDPKERTKRIAAFARKEIAAVDEQNQRALGAIPPKTITVNGRQGADLESANPDRGTIIAEWRLVGEVLQWIMDTLNQRSPVISGKYRDSHIMLADGSEADPDDHPLATEFKFYNPVPYSRKIEVGKTKSGRDFVIQVQNRIYERTADDARARFGNIAKIRFTYTASGLHKPDRVPAITVSVK
jgi:hypothetical protein